MGSPFTFTFNNPRYNFTSGVSGLSADVPVISGVLRQQFREISSLVLIIESDVMAVDAETGVGEYDDETNDTENPVQLNSTVVMTRDSIDWFNGYVSEKPVVLRGVEGNMLQVVCYGKEGILADCLCPDDDGNYVWVIETSAVQVSNVPMVACNDYGTFQGSTLFPDPTHVTGAKCWLDDSVCNSDSLDTNIGDGIYAITAVSTGAGGWFEVPDNVPAEFVSGDRFRIEGSTNNDGEWTVASATWTGSATRITVVETVGAVADGNIINPNIILSTTNEGFAPRGWVKIENEYIYFDGYDNSAADQKYRLRNVVRGLLGTSAVAHLAAVDVVNKLLKQLAPRTVTLEWNDPSDSPDKGYFELRNESEYQSVPRDGHFVLAKTASGTYRATYSVYDEDQSLDAGSVVITLDDVVKKLITAPKIYGGAGFNPLMCDFDTGIKLNRYEYDPATRPANPLEAIFELIDMLDLKDEIEFWYRHDQDLFKLKNVAADNPSFHVPFVMQAARVNRLSGVYSGVFVRYTDDQSLNLAVKEYSWHQDAGGSGGKPDKYWACAKGGESFKFPELVEITAAGNDGMEHCVDGNPGSKLGAMFDYNPNGSINFADFYFGAGKVPPAINLDGIKLTVNHYRTIDEQQFWRNANNTYIVRVQGCDDYDTTDEASRNGATWRDLGFEIVGVPALYGQWTAQESRAFAFRRVNAIRIIWDYMAGDQSGFSGNSWRHYAVLHDIEIEGNSEKYVLVQLTADTALVGNPKFIYAPASFEKLRGGVDSDGSAGCPRVLEYDAGAQGEGSAISIGQTLLKTKLRQFQEREYFYHGVFLTAPALNLEVTIDENGDGVTDYTGKLRSVEMSFDGTNGVMATGTVLNYNSDLIE